MDFGGVFQIPIVLIGMQKTLIALIVFPFLGVQCLDVLSETIELLLGSTTSCG